MTPLDYAGPDAPAPEGGIQRGLALMAGLVVILGVVGWLTGNFVVDVLLGILADGLLVTLWLVAGWGIGAPITGDRPDADHLLRRVTATALGLGALGLIFHGLGLIGWLNAPTTYAALGVACAFALYQLRTRKIADIKPWFLDKNIAHFAIPLLAIPLALALVGASVAPGFLWKPLDPHPYDVMSYHLQVPREWFDAGRILPLHHNVFSYFPMLMESHYLAAMHVLGGPWKGMYLCQMLTLTHGVLAVLAVVGVARSLGAGNLVAWAAGLLMACVPWTIMLSSVCYVEAGVMLYTTLAVGWAMLALRDGSTRRAVVIAGLCAGFACGFKYTAFAMTVAPVVALWLFFGKLSRERLIRWGILFATCALVVSPWLARNIVWTRNPVFPLTTSIFGQAHFTDEQVDRYRVAHAPPENESSLKSRLTNGFHRTFADPQFGWIVLPLGAVACAFALRSREGRFAVAVIVAMVGVWVFATHVMPRFIAPVIPLCAIVVAAAPVSLPRGTSPAAKWVVVALVIAAGVLGVRWTLEQMTPTLQLAQGQLLRLPDYTRLEAPEVTAARTGGAKIALIGDAQAFFICVPSDRLMYRTVFDVNIPEPGRIADAWLGIDRPELWRMGYMTVVNKPELLRLSHSYRHVRLSEIHDQALWQPVWPDIIYSAPSLSPTLANPGTSR